MYRFASSCSFFVACLGLAACASSTSQSRGMEVAYHPAAAASSGATEASADRLVESAVEVSDSGERTLLVAGASEVGEIEIVAPSTQGSFRFSEETAALAARRGATHFHLAGTSVENVLGESGVFGAAHEETRTRARFVLYRVNREVWPRLPAPLQPAEAIASAAPAPGAAATTTR
jgi:hypothetical protein